MARRRFIIERDIPKVGSLERAQLRDAAAKSNEALDQLAPNIHWVESYVAIFHEAELKIAEASTAEEALAFLRETRPMCDWFSLRWCYPDALTALTSRAWPPSAGRG